MEGLIGLAQRTVQRHLKQSQEKNKIERIDSVKGGYWKIKRPYSKSYSFKIENVLNFQNKKGERRSQEFCEMV